ncbi:MULTISPECIES: fumarylacetoacetate hydrolase family protein [unclassified Rathayibacter]|uniref:fumarylacetoacetate hydrolase family protein n=1 Tax=unclassified Rathayibacter TaxID=2609250 RepID=UPI0006FD3680|nr:MULTISPECIES: fumarylacetoacetate hydrolase family protein [unclassified Rathayibacter]KQQ05453.1 2-hydroxyhepta-2,4-diene-1,7-dioate isomerase [Rathayibacter sp. Leaf294]KQS13316.1 2-hydroxyhepta-2,4-diene-1,7-dioate isomerase [Rathayibacter sp. Leaf185]
MNHPHTPPAHAVVQRLGPRGSEVPVLSVGGVAFDLRPILPDVSPAALRETTLDDVFAAHAAGRLSPLEGAAGLRVGAPLAAPGKIVCIGLNYRDHAAETGAELPAEPVVFMKDPSTIGGPFDPVLIPVDSTKTDWEVELGVVIGRTARYLDSPDDALAHVAGYVLSHDVSEREFQLERGGQWDKGKSCETFNPLGPWILPAASVADPQDLGLRLSVDGVERQNGTTASMVFPVAHLIWYLSRFMVLHPGDLINTGTPAGVALGLPGTPYLRAGAVVELSIDGLGVARHEFEQATA